MIERVNPYPNINRPSAINQRFHDVILARVITWQLGLEDTVDVESKFLPCNVYRIYEFATVTVIPI